jgi:hypothetical protein
VLAWLIVAAYFALPRVWGLIVRHLYAEIGLFFPVPLYGGRFIPDPALIVSPPSGGALHRVRMQVSRVLIIFVEHALWPGAGLAGHTLHTVVTGSARVLRPRLWVYALMSAVLGSALIGLRALLGPAAAIIVATLALLCTVTARHALWLLSGEDFRRLLRRSSTNPYVTLVMLAFFDFVALTFIAFILRWPKGEDFEPRRLVTEGSHLIVLRHLTRVLDRADLSPVVVLLAIAVAAYWAALAGQLVKVTAFRRDSDDRAWVAALFLNDGELRQAMDWMRPVPREHVSAAVSQVRIRLSLVQGAEDDALGLARAFVYHLDSESVPDEGALVYLSQQIRLLSPHADNDNEWWIVDRAVAASVSDAAMFAMLQYLWGAELPADGKEVAPTHGVTPEVYPLAWTWFLGSAHRLDEAEQVIAAAPLTSTSDSAVRAIALMGLAEVRLGRRVDATREVLADVLAELSPMPVERFPLWLRDFLRLMTWRLERRARRYRLERAEELRVVRRRLLAMEPDAAEAVLAEFDAAEGARLRASRTSFDVLWGDPGW